MPLSARTTEPQRLRRPVSIKDVAHRAGVSPTTVSHVLSGKRPVNEETSARVRRVVSDLGYVPASLARKLQAGSTSVIGLLVPDISNAFFALIAKGVEDAAHELGYSVILCNTEFDSEREDHYLDLIRGRFIDAIVYAAGSKSSMARLDALGGSFPIALVDEQVNGLDSTLIAIADHRVGGRLVGAHLRELGHRSALMLSGPLELRSAADRAADFRESFGGELTELIGDFRETTGERLVAEALAGASGAVPPFTAIFAANDLMAFGAIAAVRAAGYEVPCDVSVVGFDDIRAAQWSAPPLTSVYQPAYDIGHRATAELLKSVSAGQLPPPAEHLLPVELRVRASTAPPRPS